MKKKIKTGKMIRKIEMNNLGFEVLILKLEIKA